MGLGAAKVASLQSGVEPVLPRPPTKLAVTNIEAFSVVLQFTPGFDGNSSIIKWTVEVIYIIDFSPPPFFHYLIFLLTFYHNFRLRQLETVHGSQSMKNQLLKQQH